jgi:hypothetical protein
MLSLLGSVCILAALATFATALCVGTIVVMSFTFSTATGGEK